MIWLGWRDYNIILVFYQVVHLNCGFCKTVVWKQNFALINYSPICFNDAIMIMLDGFNVLNLYGKVALEDVSHTKEGNQIRMAFRAAFPYTVPIFAGFVFLGIAYGVYMHS